MVKKVVNIYDHIEEILLVICLQIFLSHVIVGYGGVWCGPGTFRCIYDHQSIDWAGNPSLWM